MKYGIGDFRYSMSKQMAQEYLKSLKNKRMVKGNPQKLLCEWVNEEFGIKGNCIEVTTN